jgi:two-component system, chemotaxis family, CheB/CheR fusion protein
VPPCKNHRRKRIVSPSKKPKQPSLSKPGAVVAVGASSGGLDAIHAFLQAMPADAGVAVLVVQHLMPDHPSLSAEQFRSYTAMPVQPAEQGLLLQANHIYTAPPGQYVAVRAGRFVLSSEPVKKSLHYPIDHCFQSLAAEYAERAIGIVLSGYGQDASQGVEALAAQHGLVLVQDPDSALVDSMPRSAMATGCVDDVLAVTEMPPNILHYVRMMDSIDADAPSLAAHSAANTQQKSVQNIIAILLQQRGYDFSCFKHMTLMRRIGRRLGLQGLTQESEYVALLKKDSTEVDALFYDLLIGVTAFFRDPAAWDVLEAKVIKPLVASKKKDETLRLWVPGCSTGEEAYSLAVLLLDRLRLARKHCKIQIFATDTNQQALDLARAGKYPAGIAKYIAAPRLKRYFTLTADQQHYVVKEQLRQCVVFGNQNLFADPPFGRLDLISCRNVLIYLNPEIQKNIIATFHFALRSDGYLFLGNAESLAGRDDYFKPLSLLYRIYQRIGAARFQPLSLQVAHPESRIAPLLPKPAETPAAQAAQLVNKLIMERFAPAAVLVNSAFQVLHFCGPTDEFLQRPTGAPTQELLLLVRDGLRSRLHAGLLEAQTQDSQVVVAGALMKQGQTIRSVDIMISPAHGSAASAPTASLGACFLVVFQCQEHATVVQDRSPSLSAWEHHLEQELQATREDLATTTVRFEEANERLRVSSEIVLSANETLRLLNEELESAKEELQSFNEEIITVNQQLESKILELEASRNDLQNLLTSSDIATIGLDPNLCIKWFAPAAQRLLGLLPTDLGQSLSAIASAVSDSQLPADARALLDGQTVRDTNFHSAEGRRLMRRLLTYKNTAQKVVGLILTYTDITESYQSAQAALVVQRDLDASRERSDRLRTLSAALANAEERERRVLAKDLHDDLGQLLAVIGLKITLLQKHEMTAGVRESVLDCAQAVQLANNKMRDITLQLNPPMLDQLGLMPAIQWLADEMHRLHQLDVVIHDDGLPQPMQPAVSATLFRTLRELLQSVALHSSVRETEITVEQGQNNTLIVTVHDDGEGLDTALMDALPHNHATDLLNMRERIGYLGGEMTFFNHAEGGTSVVLMVPLLSAASNAEAPEALP